MPIKLGNTNISTIYKGTTPISAIYKGTTLLYQSASWELYSKVYFYNELVPTTINGKNVLNKAKIVKVSGNGVIENQLVDLKQSNLSGSGVSYSFADNKATFTSTVAGGNRCAITHLSFVSGHKYLISFDLTQSKTGTCRFQMFNHSYSAVFNGETFSLIANVKQKCSFIATANFTDSEVGTNISVYMQQNGTTDVGDTLIVENAICIDLTHREGTGNEPTSLTDNRIQNILNRGYIPFNLGKYKESDIGVISSEPYNLCDNDFENGFINNGSDLSISYCVRTPNTRPIEVLPNVSYTFSVNSAQYKYAFIVEYDENMGFIKQNGATNNTSTTATMSANTKYIRLVYGDKDNTTITTIPSPSDSQPCFHRTGTRTGYAEHKTFTPITFKAQLGGAINSHNTMEITNSAYVFTRNEWKVDMGSIAWEYAGANIFYKDISNIKNTADNTLGDIITTIYTSVKRNDLGDKNICISGTSIITKDSAYTNASVYKTAMSGTYAHYPLATPQVITIPRKHLKIVKIRDLNWQYSSSTQTLYVMNMDMVSNGDYSIANIYCSIYMTLSPNDIMNNNKQGIGFSTNYYLRVRDTSFNNTTDFLNKYGDYLIFYETQDEVADIENVIDIESGGTITTDSEVLPNIELSVKCK